MRPTLLVLAVALVTTACSPSVDDSTSTTLPASTTTSTKGGTTTTSAGPSDGVTYPLDPSTVDDLPDVLVERIGAPMPDPDLTITGPGDLDRWLAEWLDWYSWVQANPTDDPAVLTVGLVPETANLERTADGFRTLRQRGHHFLGDAFHPVGVTGTFDEQFEDGLILRVVVVAGPGNPTYVVDGAGAVVSVTDPIDEETQLFLPLRKNEEGEWTVENIEVLG